MPRDMWQLKPNITQFEKVAIPPLHTSRQSCSAFGENDQLRRDLEARKSAARWESRASKRVMGLAMFLIYVCEQAYLTQLPQELGQVVSNFKASWLIWHIFSWLTLVCRIRSLLFPVSGGFTFRRPPSQPEPSDRKRRGNLFTTHPYRPDR